MFFRLKLAGRSPSSKFADFGGNIKQRFHIRRGHDWRDQTVLSRDGDANVGVLVISNRLVLKRSVDLRVLNQSGRSYLDNDIVDAELRVRIQLIERASHVRGSLHIDFGGKKEMRHRAERGN